MKKIFLVTVFSAALVLSGCGTKTINQTNQINNKTNKTEEAVVQEKQQEDDNEGDEVKIIKDSINSILKAGNQVSCRFTKEDKNGTIFISKEGRQLNIKIEIIEPGVLTFANLLFDYEKNIIYSWVENPESRISGKNIVNKANLDSFMNKYGKIDSNLKVSLEKKFDYYCRVWDMDPKLIDPFSPPKNSDFIDNTNIDEIIKKLPSNLKI